MWKTILILSCSCLVSFAKYSSKSSHSTLQVNGKVMSIVRDSNLTDEIDMGLTIPSGTEGVDCGEGDICLDYGVAKLVVTSQDHCQRVVWTATQDLTELKDCVILDGHWYGGGEQFTQPWPIEKEPREETPYVTSDMLQRFDLWYGGVTENYWISSKGLAFIVEDTVPLFLSLPDTDGDGTADEMCFSARQEYPFEAEEGIPLQLDYTVCSADDVRQVHETTFPLYYNLPTSSPDMRMFMEPIWTTWAEYKTDINQTKVLQFAYDIESRGFNYSQLEIDDNWETCYGNAEFSPEKFPEVAAMVDELHSLGFRVTLWIHPFINDDCDSFVTADQNGFFVKDVSGQTQLTSWWQGTSSGIIDFTNPDAVAWWTNRLENLRTSYGIDSFKFDAGETNWLPEVFTLNADKALWPNVYSTSYVDTVSRFGDLLEVRTGRRNQENGIFYRMLDKNSNWTKENGLLTLVTSLLHFGIIGYPFVLPDMIGGNAYTVQPSEELFVRWTQANSLMPSLQFSLLPWRFGDTANDVALSVVHLHLSYAQEMSEAVNGAVGSVSPINRPTWWLCPTEESCLTADQQYLLGDDVLVAPILERGATEKTVVLPPGDWSYEDDGIIYTYTGPLVITLTDLTINSLPIFRREP